MSEEISKAKDEEGQLQLFASVFDDEYSSTIELFDRIPLFLPDKRTKRGTTKNALEIRRISFVHRPSRRRSANDAVEFVAEITPAQLRDKKSGKNFFYLPSTREQNVETALRKLAIQKIRENQTALAPEGEGNNESRFYTLISLYEIFTELKEHGHEYNTSAIRESLDILSKTLVTLETEDKRYRHKYRETPIISYDRVEDKRAKEGRGTWYRVWFHPLVQQAIFSEAYQSYQVAIEYDLNFLARWLYKRLAHHYTQAAPDQWYTIKMSTVLKETGLSVKKEFRKNSTTVEQALMELREKDVLGDPGTFSPKVRDKFGYDADLSNGWIKEPVYEEKNSTGGKGRRRLIDVKYHLFTSARYNENVIRFNEKKKAAASARRY